MKVVMQVHTVPKRGILESSIMSSVQENTCVRGAQVGLYILTCAVDS